MGRVIRAQGVHCLMLCVIMPARGFDWCNDRSLLCEVRRSCIV